MTLHIVGTKALLRTLDGPRSHFPRGRPRVRSRVLAALTLRRGLLSVTELADYVYGDDPEGGPDYTRGNIAAAVYSLRHAGYPIGLDWKRGYYLKNERPAA